MTINSIDAESEAPRCCAKCGRRDPLHVHHILARSDGGDDDPENLADLCASCHAEWHVVEMASRVPFEVWLEVPPLALIIPWYLAGHPEGLAFSDAKAALAHAREIQWDAHAPD